VDHFVVHADLKQEPADGKDSCPLL
jgi:hypothetical protein